MNENKDIKKLSETGEQSAEIVSGGVVNEPAESMKIKSLPPHECFLERKKCASCGKEVFDLTDGKHCSTCHLKFNTHGTKNNNEDLKESDLSQISGGMDPKAQVSNLMNTKLLKYICKYEDKKYICESCKKEFIISDPTGPDVAMAPRRIDETIYCDKCRSKIRNIFKKVK